MAKDNQKPLLPKLRFPEFLDAGDWETEKLGRLARRITIKNKDNFVSRVLTNSAVYGVLDQRDYFDKDIANKSNLSGYFILDKGDYVYNPRTSVSAPVGPISKNKLGTGVMSPLYTVFRFKERKNDFYEHYFKSAHWHHYMYKISNNGARHDRMSITNDQFMDMPLPYSKPEEQQEIANCLSSVDELIEAEAQKLDVLKDHKKGLMQNLFPAKGKSIPNFRFPEFQDAGAWEIKPFNELFKIGNGKDYKHLSSGDIPVYGSGGYMLSVNDYLYDGESACIGRKGTINNPIFLTGKFWTVDTLFYTHSFKDCFPKFIFSIFQNINWLKHNEAGGVPSLSKANIEKVKVAIPKLKEQQKIADCLSSADDLITAQTKKIEVLKEHKKGLMQQLFPAVEDVA